MMSERFRNDVHLWHVLKEQWKQSVKIAEFHEGEAIRKCKFYGYDGETCEEHCVHENVLAVLRYLRRDFVSEEQCWKCDYYTSVEGSK